MMVPVWEYPAVAKAMSQETGDPEEACFQILMTMPIRLWSTDGTKIAHLSPMEQADKAGISTEEWFDSYLTLHGIGALGWAGLGWDDESKAHYMKSPDTATQLLTEPAKA
jgi:hypothetical protein